MNSSNFKPVSTCKQTRKSRKRRKYKRERKQLGDRTATRRMMMMTPDATGLLPAWYWSNYSKAVAWQTKHKLALWKAHALALQEENKYLLGQLRAAAPGRIFHAPLTRQNLIRLNNAKSDMSEMHLDPSTNDDDGDDEEEEDADGMKDDEDSTEVTYEMSDEMMKFFEKSIKHKLEMKRLKEQEESKRFDDEVKELQEAHIQREKEMKLLYGAGSSMIVGMETAIQLSFDKYCDMKSPKYWPNIPLNL